MAYLGNLAQIARDAGLRVVETPGWKTRGHGSFSTVLSVIAHHTGTKALGVYPSLNLVTNGRSDLAGPLCNYGLGRDGTIYVVAAGVAWHAGAVFTPSVYGNEHAIGIEAENNGVGEPWAPVMIDAYVTLCRALCRAFGIPVSRVQGHKEIASPQGRKPDPAGVDMNAFRARVASAAPAPTPEPTPEPAPTEDEDMASTGHGDPTPDGVWSEFHVPINGRRYLRIATSYGRPAKIAGITMIDDTQTGGVNGVTVWGTGQVDPDRPGPWDLSRYHAGYANFSHVVVRYQCAGPVDSWVNDRP